MNFFTNFLNNLAEPDKLTFDNILSVLRESKVAINNQIAEVKARKKTNKKIATDTSKKQTEESTMEGLKKNNSSNSTKNNSQEMTQNILEQKDLEYETMLFSLENKKREITERIEFMEKNRLRLQAEKNIDEIRAFVDPMDASNLQFSEILNTHNEMMNKLQMQTDINDAKMDMILEEKKDATSEVELEENAKNRAKALIEEMKKNM